MAKKKSAEQVAPSSNKKEALAIVMAQIEKQFGKGTIMKLDGSTKLDVETFSS